MAWEITVKPRHLKRESDWCKIIEPFWIQKFDIIYVLYKVYYDLKFFWKVHNPAHVDGRIGAMGIMCVCTSLL